MPVRPLLVAIAIVAISFPSLPAQQPPPLPAPIPSDPAAADGGPEVLARGPLHEAFAATAEQPTPAEIAPKEPPRAIDELPPDQKPEGNNVQWIPGYWEWDAERTDFVWISGFWRAPPPNHAWVPGSWHAAAGGFQRTSGFWKLQHANQPAAQEVEYLPAPPANIDTGPVTPAPNASSIYVSGSWVWRGRYVWRPGFWAPYQPNWVWVPAHYRWTPIGYVFTEGYWDYPLANRGLLFTPVYFGNRTFAAGYVYTPNYVVAEPVLMGAMFVRRGYGGYYFGDYYGAPYAQAYVPWCAPGLRGAVTIVPARGWRYDPLWSYYSVAYRGSPQWNANVTALYVGRYQGTIAVPPRTLVLQNQVILRTANVRPGFNVAASFTLANNAVMVNNVNVSQHVMVAPLSVAARLQPAVRFHPIAVSVRQAEMQHAMRMREAAVVRHRVEAEALRGRGPGAIHEPVRLKVEVPHAAVHAAAVEERHRPPVAPVHPMVERRIAPKNAPRPKGPHKKD